MATNIGEFSAQQLLKYGYVSDKVRKKIKIQNVNFWLGDHAPFEYSQHPGPTAWGERQDLLIKLYRGESTRPWYPVEAVTMEPVAREDVDWPEVFKSKYRGRF